MKQKQVARKKKRAPKERYDAREHVVKSSAILLEKISVLQKRCARMENYQRLAAEWLRAQRKADELRRATEEELDRLYPEQAFTMRWDPPVADNTTAGSTITVKHHAELSR